MRRLAQTFYQVMDEFPEAADIRRMHGDDLAPVTEKLFEFLSGWLGGPTLYQQKYGRVCLIGAHRPFKIGPAERDQWLLCMDETLRRLEVPAELGALLRQPFFGIADAIRNT